jgi:2-polyprenyl-6-methoxyphenol hydroxylase-like FAD-dependent oxidoreductase
MGSNLIGRRAIVIGAGIGGCSAARALADHFDQVVIIERDRLPAEPIPRSGVPQSQQAHGLLGGGQRALEELFPGFGLDLAAAGAVPLRVGLDTRVERQGYDPFPQRDLGWIAYAMSRPLIEFVLRQRIGDYDNILVHQNCRALEITTSADRTAVTGTHYETVDGRREMLSAELVVDASGRGSITLALLESIGFPPPVTTIGVDIGYAGAVFAIPEDAPSDWKVVLLHPSAPADVRGCFLMPVENNRWMLALAGRNGDWPPGDEKGFMAFARSLRTPTVYNAIKGAKRLGQISRFGFAESTWRHFERLEIIPRGLIPIGDVICRFNPVYGQGMTVAVQEASLLHRLLQASTERDPLDRLSKSFLSGAALLVGDAWAMSAIPDLIYPQTRGERPADFDRALGFASALNRIAAGDAAVHKLMVEVHHLLKPRSVYRDPILAERVAAEMAKSLKITEPRPVS